MQRREETAELLARPERDGLSLRQLAEQSGIPFGTLSWWSWRLRQLDASNSNGGGFVEVVARQTNYPESIRKVLAAVGLSAEVPGFLPARSPPRHWEMEFDG